ncbi:hypothetical protein BC832DRAFT_594216 [Gaertneriomyces semiglobifer]|nr:hypothetical protein BC832DRAFT_594216 [Gaertneriomyces semiglobifer]
MTNLYLFRNQVTSQALVSTVFRIKPAHLSQVGQHRAEVRPRPDHWVPFAVLTNLQPWTVEALNKTLTSSTSHIKPLGKHTLPLPANRNPFSINTSKPLDPLALRLPNPKKFTGRDWKAQWQAPEEVRKKVIALCRALTQSVAVREEVASAVGKTVAIHWERDEYINLIDSADDTTPLAWPEYVEHRKLRLIRNRFPEVDGFDMKRLDDVRTATPAANAESQ